MYLYYRTLNIDVLAYLDDHCLLIQAISGLIALENDSGLLIALEILNNSATMAQYTVREGTLLGFSGIVTMKNESLLSKRPK